MAGKVKKKAKMGHDKIKAKDEVSAGSLVMISGGHRISKNISGRTDCGMRVNGWHYGSKEDVSCSPCSEDSA